MEKGAVRPRGPTAPTLLPACAHQDKAANVRLLAQVAFIVAAAFVGVIGSGPVTTTARNTPSTGVR